MSATRETAKTVLSILWFIGLAATLYVAYHDFRSELSSVEQSAIYAGLSFPAIGLALMALDGRLRRQWYIGVCYVLFAALSFSMWAPSLG